MRLSRHDRKCRETQELDRQKGDPKEGIKIIRM